MAPAGKKQHQKQKGGRTVYDEIEDTNLPLNITEIKSALASELSAPNASPSPGQVASILLSLALDTVKPVGEANGERPDPALAKKLAEKVASQT